MGFAPLRGAMPVGDRRSAVACRLREWLCAGFAGLRPAVPVSAPRHHAERRAGKGTPTSGRHSPPQAGGREGPRVAPPACKGGSAPSSAGPGVIGAGFALPRVPTGGLRSLACGQHCRSGGPHRETWRRSLVGGVVRGERMCGFRTPSGRDAGRRPALRGRAPSARVAVRGFRWPPASGASLGPRPPCRATRRHGNADLWSAQPAAGGRQGRTPSWRVVCLSAGPGVIGAGFALPRVPGPTGRTARRSAFPCLRPALPVWRPPPGALAAFLCYGRFVEAVRCRARKKDWQRTSFAAVDFGGKCERGLPPFTINNDKSELAAARLRRARKFRFPARSGAVLGRSPNLIEPDESDLPHAMAPSKERPLDLICRARKKDWQRTSFAAVDFGGKCERGLPPFTINNDKSELAAARLRRARKFRFPARSAGRFLDGAPSQSSLSEPF